MCALYQNRYRIESARLKGYDYSRNGFYFITICTKDFLPYFGEINSDKIQILNEMGEIARKFWLEIPNHFRFVKLDEFIIMPEHMHGIININNTKKNSGLSVVEAPDSGASTNHLSGAVPEVDTPNLGVSTNYPTVGSIINQYKRICTITIWKTNPEFRWQPNYYDHIIRSETDLFRIRKYIRNNPENYSKKLSHKNRLKSRNF